MIKAVLLIFSLISVICGIILMCISVYKLNTANKKRVQDVYPLHKRLITSSEICFVLAFILGIIGIIFNV